MKGLYRNPEFKVILFKILIFEVILILMMLVCISMQFKVLNKEIISQNTAVIGKILYKHPELEGDVVEMITKGPSKNDIEVGEKVLKTYGYDKNVQLQSSPIINQFYINFKYKMLDLFILMSIALLILVLLDYKKMFIKVREISVAAEKVFEGDFDIHLKENNEGDFAILAHQFNEMAYRLKLSLNKLKDEKEFLKNIISDISHQLKTPLSSLIIFNELLLQEGAVDKDGKKELLEKSSDQLNRMEWLIINLLKMARIEAGAIKFNIKSIPMIVPINNAISLLNEKFLEKDQKVQVHNDDNVYFSVDENWTCEALINIIKNSIEHTKEGGTIIIELSETPLFSRVSISDNGEGIDKEDLPNIFRRFYRAKNTVKPESIGIGLSMSKSIIESQGGTINVKSERDKGTEFIITFLKNVI